jgi:hypothetical protein
MSSTAVTELWRMSATELADQGTAGQVRDGVRAAAEALADAGYETDEAEPPSIALAARTCLNIFIPPVRAMWPATEVMFRARTRQFVSALLAAVGEHDLAAIIGSFMTRQSLQRSWAGSSRPTADHRPRLRSRYAWAKPTIMTELILMEISDPFMMRKCLLGIKQRAERPAAGRRLPT